MIKVITYSKRHWNAIPPEEHTISKEADLKTFFENVIQNDSHFVYKVECPELNTSFDCTESHMGNRFRPFRKTTLQ